MYSCIQQLAKILWNTAQTQVLTDVRKWCLLLVLTLTKQTINENREIKVMENVKKTTA